MAGTKKTALERQTKAIEELNKAGIAVDKDAFERSSQMDEGALALLESQVTQGRLEDVSWQDLERLKVLDPAASAAVWQRIGEFARDELETGHRGAACVGGVAGSPLNRARYLLRLRDLNHEWQPCNGIARALLEQMSQAFSLYEFWLHKVATYSSMRCRDVSGVEMSWHGPSLGEAESLERAAAMADRFQRMFLRSQRSLRDMRRYAPVIQNIAQVNVAAQQVNMAGERAQQPAIDVGATIQRSKELS